MKKEIKVLFVFNIDKESSTEKIESLVEYIPSTNSSLSVKKLYTYDDISKVQERIIEQDIDLILHYGFGRGLLWEGDYIYYLEGDKEISVKAITDNHSVNELFYTDKYLFTTLFDEIKKTISEIDLQKNLPSKIKIAKTKEDLEYIKSKCFSEPFGFDTETNFLNPFVKTPTPFFICASIAWLSDEEEGWCIPLTDKTVTSGQCEFSKEEAIECFQSIIFDSPQGSFCHNAAFDLLALKELYGRKPKNFLGDSMLLLNLYHHASKSAALKNNTDLINLPAYKDPIKSWINSRPKGSKKGLGFEDVPLEIIGQYAAIDAIAVIRLINFLKTNMDNILWKFYYRLPHKLMFVANDLCEEGHVLSQDRFIFSKIALEAEVKKAYNEAIKPIKRYISSDFNIGSPQQLGNILFNKLKLPVLHKTDAGEPSTDQDTLDDLILFHPVVFKIIKYRKILKLYSTYCTGYFGALNEGSKHYKKTSSWTINAQFKQTNRTARLSSTNLSGHSNVKSKGGNVLVLPAAGSMIKHYWCPRKVAEKENELFDLIIKEANQEDKIKEILNYRIAEYIKPAPIKKESTRKKKLK